MKIVLTESAVADLESIVEHYVAEQVPEIGHRFVRTIVEKIEVLTVHPDSGRIVPEFNVEHIRELIHPPFRIVYLRERNLVKIIRVWRNERLLRIDK